MDKTLSTELREKVKQAILDILYECYSDDAAAFIQDTLLDGFKGLNELTDEELVEEYANLGCDEEEDDLLIECQMDLEIVKVLTEPVILTE